MRINVGCGPVQPEGWENVDVLDWGQPHVADMLHLPFPDGVADYCVTNHALQMLPWPDLVPALGELRRVTRPGGWLRALVPDLMGACEAYVNGDAAWFPIADSIEDTIDGKLCVYVTQAGATRSVFTSRWLLDLCRRAGWDRPVVGWVDHTSTGAGPGICELDSRGAESIVVEATAP